MDAAGDLLEARYESCNTRLENHVTERRDPDILEWPHRACYTPRRIRTMDGHENIRADFLDIRIWIMGHNLSTLLRLRRTDILYLANQSQCRAKESKPSRRRLALPNGSMKCARGGMIPSQTWSWEGTLRNSLRKSGISCRAGSVRRNTGVAMSTLICFWI